MALRSARTKLIMSSPYLLTGWLREPRRNHQQRAHEYSSKTISARRMRLVFWRIENVQKKMDVPHFVSTVPSLSLHCSSLMATLAKVFEGPLTRYTWPIVRKKFILAVRTEPIVILNIPDQFITNSNSSVVSGVFWSSDWPSPFLLQVTVYYRCPVFKECLKL